LARISSDLMCLISFQNGPQLKSDQLTHLCVPLRNKPQTSSTMTLSGSEEGSCLT